MIPLIDQLQVLNMLPLQIPNPPPQAPPGVGPVAAQLLGWVKYGALFVIIAAGFIGVALVAIGKWFSHERSSNAGVKGILGALGAAILYGLVYGLITLFAT